MLTQPRRPILREALQPARSHVTVSFTRKERAQAVRDCPGSDNLLFEPAGAAHPKFASQLRRGPNERPLRAGGAHVGSWGPAGELWEKHMALRERIATYPGTKKALGGLVAVCLQGQRAQSLGVTLAPQRRTDNPAGNHLGRGIGVRGQFQFGEGAREGLVHCLQIFRPEGHVVPEEMANRYGLLPRRPSLQELYRR